MKFKIIGDSSCDVSDVMRHKMNIELAPLTMEVDGKRYVDDDDLDIKAYLDAANASAFTPKTSCPAPDDFLTRIMKSQEEGIFIITLSSELSGSYASAMLAKSMYEEDYSEKKVHVFNSLSASSGQVAIAFKVHECIEAGMEFEAIVTTVEDYIRSMTTVFVLEKIDHLQKAGRMSKMKATLANVLHIKLILRATKRGEIDMVSQARGTKKALSKMINSLGDLGTVAKDRIIIVGHCQAGERGQQVVESIKAMYDFKDVVLVAMRGLSSNYANVGGIVLAY